MEHTKKTMNELYESLGKLFYGIAIADGNVHTKEWDKVKEIVKEDWLYVDDVTDRYGTDAANQIEIVFDGLMEYEKTSDECFKDFKDFYVQHPNAFSKEIITLALQTANAIANAFAGKSKKELIFLTKLKLLLKSYD